MGESPSNRLEGDLSAGLLQRTGAIGEGGPAHPFNRDGGLEVLGCWIAVIRKQGGRNNPQ